MSKRVFMVHGWGDYLEEAWFPWLKHELEQKGFEVVVPQLPDPEVPRIEPWVGTLARAVGIADAETFFVGHSLGCQTIVRYLEALPDEIKIGGAVFVAGFFKSLTNLEDEVGVPETAAHWLETPIDLQKAVSHLPKSVAIFSDNDPFVPLDNQDAFRDVLHSKIILEHNKGHFSGADGVIELPSALTSLLGLGEKI